MNILGLETSTAVCSAGIVRQGGDPIERSIRESHIHSEKLLTLVQDVFSEAGLNARTLDAIAVSIGPGSFTGLRIGLSTAKGLAYALGKPLVAVHTFDAIAEAARLRKHSGMKSLAVLIDARNNEWYVGRFDVEGGTRARGPVDISPLAELVQALRNDPPSLILTDRPALIAEALDIAATIEDVHVYCRGDVVASLGSVKALRREFDDAASLEPMYLKNFVVRSAPSVL